MATIGPIKLKHPVVMAPMAGVTDLPYRLIAREQGAALVYSELVSAKGICYGSRKTLKLLETDEAERPVGLQIFGGEAGVMVEAARHVERFGPDLLDINMGCPVPKITNNDEGAALDAGSRAGRPSRGPGGSGGSPARDGEDPQRVGREPRHRAPGRARAGEGGRRGHRDSRAHA